MPTSLDRLSAPLQGRLYLVRTLACMGVYVLIHLVAILGLFDGILGQSAGWIVAAAVALPVAGHIGATLRWMADCDEYVRAIVAKCVIVAGGITVALWTAWGFGETYAAAAHLPGWLLYPFFLALCALVAPFVRTSR